MTERQLKRIKALGLNPADFEPSVFRKSEEKPSDTVTDEVGNVYKQMVNTDGTVTLKLVESYTGILYE